MALAGSCWCMLVCVFSFFQWLVRYHKYHVDGRLHVEWKRKEDAAAAAVYLLVSWRKPLVCPSIIQSAGAIFPLNSICVSKDLVGPSLLSPLPYNCSAWFNDAIDAVQSPDKYAWTPMSNAAFHPSWTPWRREKRSWKKKKLRKNEKKKCQHYCLEGEFQKKIIII